MCPTDSPRRTVWVQAAGGSAVLAVAPRLAVDVILVVVLVLRAGARFLPSAGGGLVALLWAWDTAVGARTAGASRTGTSSARPITRRTRAGRSLTDRTRRSGWRRRCSVP